MRATAAALTLLAWGVATGCGGASDAGSATRHCQEVAASARAGTCPDAGRRYVFSGPAKGTDGSNVEIAELRARLEDWSSIDVFESRGQRSEAEGRYVAVDVAITNLTDEPQGLGSPHRLTRLVFDGRTYYEAAQALDGGAQDVGFDVPIAPGATVTAAFVYDMPDSVADTLPNGRGALEIANFSARDIDAARELAVLRMGDGPLAYAR